MVLPYSRLSLERIVSTSWADDASRLPVGSSARITSGSLTIARAIATRCSCPPESWRGKWPRRSPNPTSLSAMVACSTRAALFRLVSLSGSSTFSSAVSTGIKLNCWNTNPMCSLRQRAMARSLRRRRSSPSTRISPSLGRSMAAMRWSSVDLPEPDGPMRATNSPFRISRLTWCSAIT